MDSKQTRTYSQANSDAVLLLGRLIRLARKERNMTLQELADRAGISRGLVQRIEKGDPNCTIGLVFEAATIVGVTLFESEKPTLPTHIARTNDKIALLPRPNPKTGTEVDDDF